MQDPGAHQSEKMDPDPRTSARTIVVNVVFIVICPSCPNIVHRDKPALPVALIIIKSYR
jgi:hypothetical protein